MVLVSLRDYQDEKCDVVHKYLPEEVRSLKAYNEIPESIVVLEEEGGAQNNNDVDVTFQDSEEEDKDDEETKKDKKKKDMKEMESEESDDLEDVIIIFDF